MSTPIRIKRSAVPGKRPTVDQLLSAELAYNTYDGELTAKRERPGIGTDIIRIGAGATVTNVIYVTKDGNDNNTGLKLGDAKATIAAAVGIASAGSVIRVSAGSYVENNPIDIPNQVSIVGDSLREVSVTPQNQGDLFYVGNGNYIAEMAFVGSANTGAIFAFNPNKPVFNNQSPYIQNCTNFIPNSIGMKVDGRYSIGPTKSMVLDSYTQYNQGGIGVSITNEGYAQLVSLFTICPDTAVFCGSGGACDLTNSNASFGNYGLVADGVGPRKYTGIVTVAADANSDTFVLDLNVPTFNVSNAVYDNKTGDTTITIPGFLPTLYERIELRDLRFSCSSGGISSVQSFPSGTYGYEFTVKKVNPNNSFVVNVGLSTLPHTYVGGGFVVNRSVGIQTASYSNITGIVTVTSPNARTKVGDVITLVGLGFTCPSGPTTLYYPSGKNGYQFKVNKIIGLGGTIFEVNVGTSTLPHTYVGGGVVKPAYSIGVGPITQGPYIRNCTNFISNSIGMKVDGFEAEPGDKDDIGVTGTMSVDSYTQYNQGGIGVSITNGAYSQLVSIFTICDDIGIYTESGGQCDITNSNASFGNYGLYSKGVGDQKTKSIYRYTGNVFSTANIEQDQVVISGIGKYRPYDGQALYFGELYYSVAGIAVTDPGFGYLNSPIVTISSPTGPNGVQAEGSSNIDISSGVISVDIISSGSQYRLSQPPQVVFSAPDSGIGRTAKGYAILAPIYYNVQSATLPSSGITTVILTTNLNNTVEAGTTVYFSRLSLQLATSISLEYVGAGTNINLAKPALGGVSIQENEVVMTEGGKVVYTSTNQAGDFRIGDGIAINQLTGTISGRAFNQSILANVTPLIIALGG